MSDGQLGVKIALPVVSIPLLLFFIYALLWRIRRDKRERETIKERDHELGNNPAYDIAE